MAQNYIDSIAKMRRAGNAELKREKTMLKFEKADKQEVTKCRQNGKGVKRTLGQKTEDRTDEIYSG